MVSKKLLTIVMVFLTAVLVAGCVSVTTTPEYDADGNIKAPETYGTVKLGKYTGLTASESILDITDEDIQIEIDYYLSKSENAEFTDEWVIEQTDGECSSTEEFREYCKKDLERAMAENAKAGAQDDLINQVVKSSTFNINKTAIDYEYQEHRKELENFVRSYGMDFDSYIKAFSSSAEQFEKDLTEVAQEKVKQRIVTEAIAQKEGISIDEVAEFLYDNATIER